MQQLETKKTFWKNRAGVAILVTLIGAGGLLVAKFIPALRPRQEASHNKSSYAISRGEIAPSVTITSPSDRQHLHVQLEETGAGTFFVYGTSSGVFRTDLKIYVLLLPVFPFAPDWWAQPVATISSNGWWRAKAWYGYSEAPPQVGNTIDILAVVVNPDRVPKEVWPSGRVPDLKSLNSLAQSQVIHLTVRDIY